MLSATLIAFLAILVIAVIRKAESAPVAAETPEQRPLKQLESITKCPFEVKEDFDAERSPQRIQKVVCKPTACNDCDAGFQCVQATVDFEVIYKSNSRPTKVPIEYGCYYVKLDGESVEANKLPSVSS